MSDAANQSLVSIIIPCYNCERWVAECIESCLGQSYPNVEIIVVDDGSTDGSLEILRRFVPRIRLETGPNRGGNNARNRGFALSSGAFIQFLDADDYLQPDKIARQVRFLEETGADVVYGDWQYRRHLPDSNVSYLDNIQVIGERPDFLLSMLSYPWRINGGAVLYRRRVVSQVGGWDEALRAAQDIDFLTSAALSGADVRYQAGCHFVYRKYGAVTVSNSNLARWMESICVSLGKSESALSHGGKLDDEYRRALATGYFELARACYWFDAKAALALYPTKLDPLTRKIAELCPQFHASDESRVFTILQRLLGFRRAVRFLLPVRASVHIVESGIKQELKNTFLFNLVLRSRGMNLEDANSPQGK